MTSHTYPPSLKPPRKLFRQKLTITKFSLATQTPGGHEGLCLQAPEPQRHLTVPDEPQAHLRVGDAPKRADPRHHFARLRPLRRVARASPERRRQGQLPRDRHGPGTNGGGPRAAQTLRRQRRVALPQELAPGGRVAARAREGAQPAQAERTLPLVVDHGDARQFSDHPAPGQPEVDL